ncbi:T-cell surface antigen CD2-like [Rana temporaria]|uniref:T-cell surface antigen CD2-like n=1 Tax=Rana temporaria TaxID=8407 RepID=UPI001AADBA77|nr:T-cell surface antigen CD2-like [Rana temporaria]
MEGRGAAGLSFWTSLGLLLISGAAVGTMSQNAYSLDTSVQLDVSGECNLLTSDAVEWKKDNKRLQKKTSSRQTELDPNCNCKILSNGSLYLQRLEKEGEMTYVVDVHDSIGKHKCTKSVTVIGQYPVDTPFMNFTCHDRKKIEVFCFIPRGTEPELYLKQGGATPRNGKSLSQNFTLKPDANFTCTAKNKISETSHTLTPNCDKEEGWNWYLYLAVGAGGVAFIIFIALIIYSVRSCRRPDEETMYNNRRQIIQERHLPQPPVQASAPPPSVATTDEIDYINSQKPHRQGAPETAPEGKKGRRTRPRPPEPPNVQSENLPLHHQGAAPQQTRPALPGNHPNDTAPRPTPRTKSKPPRQNRKSH